MRRIARVASTSLVAVFVATWSWWVPQANAQTKRFDGHQVVGIEITDEADVQTVLALEEASEDFDFWMDSFGIGVVHVRVSPEQRIALDASGLTYVVVVDDVQALVHYERSGGAGFYEDFRTYEEYLALMNDLASTHPDLAEVVSLGKSLEGRDMWALHITGPGDNKPGVLYHGCIHASEWFTSPIVVYTAEYLLTNYETEPTVRMLVDNVEWFMMPILNVDGYVYTWTTDRWWRKNRRDNGDGTFGVDLNRNWGRGWGVGPTALGDPGSNMYRGPAPFSEPETQVVRDFLLANPNIRSYLDVHIFGGFLGSPWAYISQDTPDEPTFAMVGEEMAERIRAVIGTEYRTGPMYEIMGGGTVGGLAIDWVYGDAGRWSYLAELYAWSWDFAPEEILPACEEHFSAMLFLGEWTGACDPYASRAGVALVPDEFPDCNGDGNPDVCEFSEGLAEDCNGNNVPDACDLAAGTSEDCQVNGTPDECELRDCAGDVACLDCNGNDVPDECDIVSNGDCDADGVPDECAAGGVLIDTDFESGLPGTWTSVNSVSVTGDCSADQPGCSGGNWAYLGAALDCAYVEDETAELRLPTVTLGHGASELRFCSRVDVEPEWDFARVLINSTVVWEQSVNTDVWLQEVIDLTKYNGQTVDIVFQFYSDEFNAVDLGWQIDNVYLIAGTPDCDDDNVPDSCQADIDCNLNGVYDGCDIAALTSPDCNGNNNPDECEIDENSTAPGGPFYCTANCDPDCNDSGLPDTCEPDGDGDGVPDVCDPCPHDNPDDFDGDGACNSSDECPYDPDKILAGDCGCGNPEDDADGDGVPDCIDLCPGVDDTIYAPDCTETIPTVSTWGLTILALLLITAAKVCAAGRCRSEVGRS